MECLIAVGFRIGKPVAEAGGVRLIDFRQCGVDSEAFVFFLVAVCGDVDDSDGKDVKHLLEGDVLVLHLHPDGVGTLDSRLDGVVHAHGIQPFADGRRESFNGLVAHVLGVLELLKDVCVGFGVFIAEAEVFEFRFDFVESESVCDGREDVERFSRDFVLFGRQHAGEGSHVVESVGDFDEDDADVVAHGEQ